MNDILLIAVTLISLFILGVAIQTIIETRRRYYNQRKRNE